MTDLFNEVYACKNEQAKNNVIAAIAEILDKRLNDDEKTALRSTIRKAIMGNHFDAYSAKQRISQMYYTTTDGCIIQAPFVSERECAELYEEYKSQIKGYNLYDFKLVFYMMGVRKEQHCSHFFMKDNKTTRCFRIVFRIKRFNDKITDFKLFK